MKRLIKNLFQRKTFKLPAVVLKGFTDTFHKSINIEWSNSGKVYEALFYEQELEKIARFDKKGKLIEIRTNISASALPKEISSLASSHGELMNAISILRDNQTFHEVIVRQDAVKRYMLLINQNGEILKKEKL